MIARLPQSIVDSLIVFCQGEGCSLAEIGNDTIHVIVIGRADLDANTAHLLAANLLIRGVIDDLPARHNAAKMAEEEENARPTPPKKVM